MLAKVCTLADSVLARAVVLGFAYWLSVILAIQLVFPNSRIALFWPPNAITVAALLLSSRKQWPLYLCATAVAYLVAIIPLTTMFISFVSSAANLVEIFILAIVVRKFIPGPATYLKLPKIFPVIIWATVPAILISTSISSIRVIPTFDKATFFNTWLGWFVGDLSGLLLVLPALLMWMTPGTPSFKSYNKNEVCPSSYKLEQSTA
jgi:integral membrane sensor domain MASE1